MKKHSKIFRSVVALLLAFIMVGTVIPTMAFAADKETEVQETINEKLSFVESIIAQLKGFIQRIADMIKNIFGAEDEAEPEPDPEPTPDPEPDPEPTPDPEPEPEPEPEPDRNPVYMVKSAAELQNAINDIKARQEETEVKEKEIDSATVVLDGDIVVDGSTEFMFTDSKGGHFYLYHVDMTLDLNGHNIYVLEDAVKAGQTYATGVFIIRYSTLNIVGEGRIIVKNKAIAVYGWAHSTINIYGGTYVANSSERKESAVYVNNTSVTLNVYGGTYTDSAFAFNTHNTSCTGPVIILHEGITFVDYQNHFSDDYKGGRIVIAEGCDLVSETLENGNTSYTVVAK